MRLRTNPHDPNGTEMTGPNAKGDDDFDASVAQHVDDNWPGIQTDGILGIADVLSRRLSDKKAEMDAECGEALDEIKQLVRLIRGDVHDNTVGVLLEKIRTTSDLLEAEVSKETQIERLLHQIRGDGRALKQALIGRGRIPLLNEEWRSCRTPRDTPVPERPDPSRPFAAADILIRCETEDTLGPFATPRRSTTTTARRYSRPGTQSAATT